MRKLKFVARELKRDLLVYQLALKDRRTPKLAKVLLGAAVFYAHFPFDIIPDFLPIVGHLDDAYVVPVVIWTALKMIPQEVIKECRMKVMSEKKSFLRARAKSRRK